MNLEKMDRMPTVAAVMTPFPHSIDIDASLERAREAMARHRFHHLPVVEKGRLVGLVSAWRLAKVEEAGELRGRVRDFCTLAPQIVATTAPLDAVLAKMAREQIHTVLVVKEGKLAGIFTLSDACRHFAAVLRRKFPSSGGDEAA